MGTRDGARRGPVGTRDGRASRGRRTTCVIFCGAHRASGSLPNERSSRRSSPRSSPCDAGDTVHLAALEHDYRSLWNRTRASIDDRPRDVCRLSGLSHGGPRRADGSTPRTTSVDGLPGLTSLHDRRGLMTRLRIVMEDPGQLVSNAAAHYVIDQLCASGNRPVEVFIPGFTGVVYPARRSPVNDERNSLQ